VGKIALHCDRDWEELRNFAHAPRRCVGNAPLRLTALRDFAQARCPPYQT
jgi:hypothetical protein